jgi:hypothetical protein
MRDLAHHYAAVLSPHWRFRSAITGKFVTRLYAALNPHTTIRERA